MEQIIRVTPQDGYRLEIEFADGLHGIVCLTDRLFGPVFEPLKNLSLFQEVAVDEFGAICWPNGADLAPDALYETIRRQAHGICAA